MGVRQRPLVFFGSWHCQADENADCDCEDAVDNQLSDESGRAVSAGRDTGGLEGW